MGSQLMFHCNKKITLGNTFYGGAGNMRGRQTWPMGKSTCMETWCTTAVDMTKEIDNIHFINTI